MYAGIICIEQRTIIIYVVFHMFLTFSETSVFKYKVDNYYNKESEAGIIYDDELLNINWNIEKEKIIISE